MVSIETCSSHKLAQRLYICTTPGTVVLSQHNKTAVLRTIRHASQLFNKQVMIPLYVCNAIFPYPL